MKRKILLCVALALLLSFSVQPAAAITESHTMIIEATCRLPIIRVTIPTRAEVYLNPFEIPVSIGGIESAAQVISTPASIANMSEVPLKVDVTVTGTIKENSTMALTETPTGGTGSDKEAFVYFEIVQANTGNPDDVTWAVAYDASKHIVVKNGAVTKENVLTLPAKTSNDEVAENGYAPFRLAGDAVEEPTDEWNEDDGIDVTVAFTFTPLPYSSNP